jgi:hypothetical protein
METVTLQPSRQVPWNKGRLTGQKPALKLNEIWAIRTRLQFTSNVRELAMFNLAIDSKLRACDLTPPCRHPSRLRPFCISRRPLSRRRLA